MSHLAVSIFVWLATQLPAGNIEISHAAQAPIRSEIRSIARGWTLTLEDGRTLPGAGLAHLHRLGIPLPPVPVGPRAQLAGGDILAGKLLESDGVSFAFETATGRQVLKIPASKMGVLWLQSIPRQFRQSDDRWKWFFQVRRRDMVLLTSGEWLSGSVGSISAETLKFQDEAGKAKLLPRSEIQAIAFSTELIRNRPSTEEYAVLTLRDGSRISLRSATMQNQQFIGTTFFRQDITLPWSAIAVLRMNPVSTIWLSDLKPKDYRYTPWLMESHSWVADRNSDGGPLQLRDAVGVHHYDKGLGMHSRSAITFSIDGKYQLLEALVGLDADLGRLGNVRVRVLLDGKDSPAGSIPLTGNDPPRLLSIPLTGAKEVTLEVDWGEGGPVQDVVNWVNARLVR